MMKLTNATMRHYLGSPCCWDQPRFDFGLVVAKIVKAVVGHDLDLTSLYANENLKLESTPLTYCKAKGVIHKLREHDFGYLDIFCCNVKTNNFLKFSTHFLPSDCLRSL